MRDRLGIGKSWLVLGIALSVALPASAVGQSTEARETNPGDGFRVSYGPSVAHAILDDAAHEPFSHIGDFRPGLGIQAGVGYQLAGVELVGTADLSGFEMGEPVVRDGVDMGRVSSVLRTFTLAVWWSPPPLVVAGWRPRLGVGYLRTALDNVRIAPSELTPGMLAVLRTAEPGDDSKPAGIEGAGVRVGLGAEREVGPDLAALFRADLDRISYDTFTFGRHDIAGEGGVGWMPRASISIRWAP